MSRNAYDIIFRVVELGVALWFPCVLWNSMSPEQLWILNPKKILKKLDIERTLELGQSVKPRSKWICTNYGFCTYSVPATIFCLILVSFNCSTLKRAYSIQYSSPC